MNVLDTAMWLCTPYLKTDYKDRLSAPLQCSREEYNIFLISCQGGKLSRLKRQFFNKRQKMSLKRRKNEKRIKGISQTL